MASRDEPANAAASAKKCFEEIVTEAATQDAPLFGMLARTATRHAGKTAIIDGQCHLTYGELLRLSTEFSDSLNAAGVQPGDALGLALANGKEFVIAAFGCWRTGASLVPINAQLHQPDVLRYVMDVNMRALVTDGQGARAVAGSQVGTHIEQLLVFPSAGDSWSHVRPREARRATPHLEGPRLRIRWPSTTQYSTGSTSLPKRVTRSQAHFTGEQQALSSVLGVTADDRILGVAPFSHGYSLMYSVLLPLLSGGTVVTVRRFLPGEVASIIERERISGLSTVPFMYELLAKLPTRHDFSSVRFALSGGAPLTLETARAFEQHCGIRLRQAYGSTETGAISIVPEEAEAGDVGFVGAPVPGVTVRILDAEGRPVSPGSEGYVHVNSPFAAQYYDSDPGSRESYFTENGVFPGDVGRLSEAGNLTLTGRQRGFINVGGVKVDPGEVEAILAEHPSVLEAVVIGMDDGAAGQRLHAFLVTSVATSPEEVRRHCAERLSAFKVPKVIEFRRELPRSPLGKVLRQQLIDEASNNSSA